MVKSFINGNLLNSDSENFLPLINPATNREIDQIQMPTQEDFEKAISSAKEGFLIWSSMSPTDLFYSKASNFNL